MLELRPVNSKIGNLRLYQATELCRWGDRLTIQFNPLAAGSGSFCILLKGVLRVADHGLLYQPLTAGVVWKPVGPFGLEAAAGRDLDDVADLIEMRLDHEAGSRLFCRFQAVASAADVWDCPDK